MLHQNQTHQKPKSTTSELIDSIRYHYRRLMYISDMKRPELSCIKFFAPLGKCKVEILQRIAQDFFLKLTIVDFVTRQSNRRNLHIDAQSGAI